MVGKRWGFRDRGTLKLGVSHKSFDELSRWLNDICILRVMDIHWSYQNLLFWAGIVWHRLSANQIVRCFKLKKLKNCMRYQVFFFFSSIEVTKNTLFWVVPESSLGQSVCRIFYFWLVWLVDLNTGGPLLHCTCFYWKIWWILWKSSVIILWCYKDVGKRTNKWFGKH